MSWDTIGVFASAAVLSACAGVAALLRSGKPVTKTSIVTVVLNTGTLGLAISLLWYSKFQDNLYFLVGVCIVAGLGGMTTIDAVLAAIKRGGFSVKIGQDGNAEVPGISVKPADKEP